eukprot:1847147-Amphidinium_carterae.2
MRAGLSCPGLLLIPSDCVYFASVCASRGMEHQVRGNFKSLDLSGLHTWTVIASLLIPSVTVEFMKGKERPWQLFGFCSCTLSAAPNLIFIMACYCIELAFHVEGGCGRLSLVRVSS